MLPKLGLGRPGGSRVLHTGAHALKDRPAGRGAHRWTGEAALELRGCWLPSRGAPAFPAFPDGPPTFSWRPEGRWGSGEAFLEEAGPARGQRIRGIRRISKFSIQELLLINKGCFRREMRSR